MNKITKKNILLLVFLFLQIIITIATFAYTRQSIIAKQQALIGKLYGQSPEVCELLVRDMFEITGSLEEQRVGESALVELGYTKSGAEYLYRESELPKLHLLITVLLLLIAGCLVCTFFASEKQRRMDAERLAADMGKCLTSQKELQTSHYCCNATLVSKISEVIKTFHAKDNELKGKNQQTQKFVENIAHQIKTPLSCISVSLDLLLTDVRDPQQKKRIEQSFTYLKEIETLLKKLLDIGRIESGKLFMKKTAIHLEDLLEECQLLLDPEGTRFTVTTETQANASTEYYGDYEWLKEAFTNIMKNSMEHDTGDKPIQVRLVTRKENSFIQIRDYGPGIASEDLKHIFDRFYIPDSAKKSHTGIGLNLAELVFRKHFGMIEAANHEDGGAVFSVFLPTYGLKNEKI